MEERAYNFAALSYFWGDQDPEQEERWQLNEANKTAYYRAIDIGSLPSLIRDAITIAARLGLAYIWVDALCIMQDNPSDWAGEANKMGGIYLGSLVTIAASASTSVNGRCFNLKSQRTCDADNFELCVTIEGRLKDGRRSGLSFFQYVPNVYRDEVLNGLLSKRAWAYQEFVLPQRKLYYTSKQLFWECMHCRCSEDNHPQEQGQKPYPLLDFDYELDSEMIADYWYCDVVVQYSKRQLTFGKDKLIAISALARATYRKRPDDYITGWSQVPVSGSPIMVVGLYELWHLEADPINLFGDVSSAYIDIHTKVGTGILLRDYFKSSSLSNGLWSGSQALMIPHVSNNNPVNWLHGKAMMDNSGSPGERVTLALLR
ncbi:heterokaryon incompatibility protein-domain-containing protein [Xylaria venustula]|nr:heterokaryon incompatibility protein-domain-containing protein [Xylaria venustula]